VRRGWRVAHIFRSFLAEPEFVELIGFEKAAFPNYVLGVPGVLGVLGVPRRLALALGCSSLKVISRNSSTGEIVIDTLGCLV
jgi:hypothetical protein